MIRLSVEPYCHGCPSFYPDYDICRMPDGNAYVVVKCDRSEECKHIKQYLERREAVKARDRMEDDAK